MSEHAASVVTTTNHVGINVVDLDRSIAFYTSVLGLTVGHRSPDESRPFAYLTAGGQTILTLWEQATGEFSTSTAGLHHLAFRLPSTEAFAAAERAIRAAGVTIYHDGVIAKDEDTGALFFEDPDGTRLEISGPYAEAPASPSDGPACGFF